MEKENKIMKCKFMIIHVMISLCAFILMGCNKADTRDDEKILTVGIFQEDTDFLKKVSIFNQENEYKIEIVRYDSVSYGEDPYQQLKIEIAAGKGPDIINFGGGYSESVAAGSLTDDLYVYMDSDGAFQREAYFENILKAYEVDEELPVVPESFSIDTAVGLSEYFQNMEEWNYQELSAIYERHKEGHILYPGESKSDVFGFLCTGSMSEYMDWEKGSCNFDKEQFKDMVNFSNAFPDQMVYSEDMKIRQMFADGTALLYRSSISNVWGTGLNRALFEGKDITYLGYPGIGNVAKASHIVLGINANSQHKEAAWKLIKYFLSEDYQTSSATNLPIHQNALLHRIEEAKKIQYKEADGEKIPVVKELYFEGEDAVQIDCITEKDADTLLALIESVRENSEVDYSLYNIILEEIQPFFDGDKSLEDTVKVIQSKLSIAMAEKLK